MFGLSFPNVFGLCDLQVEMKRFGETERWIHRIKTVYASVLKEDLN
jgi:hypothetical protein